ncbi:MAG: hypothetical protein M1438_12620 [Deltaproteobacteria bacterium]|nr:hypothetical protein [Deltaproteobacteria bacterium]
MSIFSRRIIQRLINQNAQFLLKSQTQSHVNQLNLVANEATLAFEWEIVLLYAFSKVGKVIHEKNLGGKTNPDIYFESFAEQNNKFVAEIVTVSDKGWNRIIHMSPFRMIFITLLKNMV